MKSLKINGQCKKQRQRTIIQNCQETGIETEAEKIYITKDAKTLMHHTVAKFMRKISVIHTPKHMKDWMTIKPSEKNYVYFI